MSPSSILVAASYYKLAADQGDKESQYCLGYAYATGKGVEEDIEDGECGRDSESVCEGGLSE